MDELCQICKDTAEIPHFLPCNHFFCLYCIIKHIKARDFCPKCFLSPLTIADLYTNITKKNNLKIPSLIFKRNESNYIKILKQYRINIKGSKKDLEWRFNELLDVLHCEKFKEKPCNNIEIAWKVHSKEKMLFKPKKVDNDKVFKSLLVLKKLIASKKKENEGF